MKKIKEYALYKGDELLMIGTANEICKEFNISERTLKHYTTNTYRKRIEKSKNPEKTRIAILIDDEEVDAYSEVMI